MDHDLQARVVELELKFMEQAAVLDELDSVVRQQDARLDRLERQLRDLTAAGEDDGE